MAVSQGPVFNRQLNLEPGSERTVLQAWDYCGGSTSQQLDLQVQDSAPAGSVANTFTEIQAVPGWNQWGELAPVYDICYVCDGITWKMQQNSSGPSLSGKATRFDIGGYATYGDVLW